MRIITAEVLGMCFGVRDALRIMDVVDEPEHVTIHGELVHNELVLNDLSQRGFHMIRESARRPLPMTQTVLVTAHGVSDKERRRLETAGKRIIDTTCPLVVCADEAAQKLQYEGRHVLVIGKRGHIEIQGIVEDLDSYEVIENPDEVQHYPFAKLGVMCQTTSPCAWSNKSATLSPTRTAAPTSASSTPSAIQPRITKKRWTIYSSKSRQWWWSAAATRTTPASSWPAAANAALRPFTFNRPTISFRPGSKVWIPSALPPELQRWIQPSTMSTRR